MNRIIRENNKILSVNLYLCSGNTTRGLSDDTMKPANQDSLILQAVRDKSHITMSFSKDDRKFIADYFYRDFRNFYRDNNGPLPSR